MSKFPIIFVIAVSLAVTAVSCKNNEQANDPNQSVAKQTVVTSSFKVWGNCEMCKETIEGSLKSEGIVKADWDTKTKQIEVTYDTTKISLDQIQKNIAAAGYDNEKYKSDEKAYGNLPECCQYERK